MRSPDAVRIPTQRACRAVVLLVLALVAGGVALPQGLGDTADPYEEAISTILCDCGCHPQSVKECACGRAAEMRGEIAALAGRGMSGEAIIGDYVERHGEQIRIAPTASGFNLIAWLGPLALLVVATVGLGLSIRRWAARAAAAAEQRDADDARESAVAPDTAELDRLDRALEDWS